jgi:hypothetical protein
MKVANVAREMQGCNKIREIIWKESNSITDQMDDETEDDQHVD